MLHRGNGRNLGLDSCGSNSAARRAPCRCGARSAGNSCLRDLADYAGIGTGLQPIADSGRAHYSVRSDCGTLHTTIRVADRGDRCRSARVRIRRAEIAFSSRTVRFVPATGGPKTAACVLVFSMGRAAFPVDTHVHRIAVRLGWIPPGTSAEQAHRILGPAVPPGIRYDLHPALIEHGREVCKAQHPRCGACVLRRECPYGRQTSG